MATNCPQWPYTHRRKT